MEFNTTLMPQQLHVGIGEALKWEGVHVPIGPNLFEVRPDFQYKDVGHLVHASKNGTYVGMHTVEL